MPVSINILNKEIDNTKPEGNASLAIKEMLSKSISSNASGNIYITYGLTLCGQSPRDVDILVVGCLDNCILNNFYTNDYAYAKKDLCVESFCVVIELKDHDESRVLFNNTHVFVNYKDEWKDATEQNESQRYSFLNYFSNACGYKPFVSNFIWLRSLSKQQIASVAKDNPTGALPGEFGFKELISTIINQGHKPSYDSQSKRYNLRSIDSSNNFLDDIKRCVQIDKLIARGMTRRKLEILTQHDIAKINGQIDIGQHLTIFKGRAGTGKTFRLVQSALYLANPDTGNRCLLLTYNHALVSDIRRLLYFMDIPDGIDGYTVQIKTLHSFFMQMMKSLGISTQRIYGNSFNSEYQKALCELYDYVTVLMESKDIKQLKQDNALAIDWDYILIDEAQDWADKEKEILFKVYGSDRIVVADGVDQFIRSNNSQKWGEGVERVSVDNQKKGMRQKRCLTEFVNSLAEELSLKWNVAINKNQNYAGGKVIICSQYDDVMHRSLVANCNSAECENYDMLFLVPPTMVVTDEDGKKHFSKLDAWSNAKIKLFDGTNDKNREQYPVDIEQCRMYQYESCRGLEGWVTVCLHFDELIEYKLKEAKKMTFSDQLGLASKETQQREYAYLWSLMPLTRPMDTLVIQLTNPESDIGKHLKIVAEKMPDIVTWNIN